MATFQVVSNTGITAIIRTADRVSYVVRPQASQVFQIDTSKGSKGDRGPGIAIGGTEGRALVKASSTDYDTEWGFKLTVSSTEPVAPEENDLWVPIS